MSLKALVVLLLAAGGGESWTSTPLPGPMPEATSHGVAKVNGVELYYASYGSGPPVILLHGGAGNADHWAFQVPAFAARFRVIVVDTRGHGRSGGDGRPMSYALFAQDVLGLLDHLELPQAAVVGWSDGGATALELALAHPQRVSRLVLYGTNYNLSGMRPGGGAAFAAYFQRCAADYRKLSSTPKGYPQLLAALRPMWRTQPDHPDEDLARLTMPTLVLDGDHDEIIRPEHLEEMVRHLPRGRLAWLPGASHFALFQVPAAFNQAVLEFLAPPDGG